jgi:glycosyltransferase involved in cell wall biosynthesis
LIVFDGLHTAAAYCGASGLFKGADLPIVYRAHNREFRIWKRKASVVGNLLSKLFFEMQAWLVGRFENSLVVNAMCTCTVSQEDIEDFQQDCPNARYLTVPIGDDFSVNPTPATSVSQLFFVGRLDWQPNVEGLRWFLESVWPEAKQRRPELELKIVGSGKGDWLQSYASLPGISILGRVESLEPYYQDAAICLIPIFFGSGTRVKAIEASRYGRPCLSTAIGVEGLPLSNSVEYFNGETSEEWIDTLVHLDLEELNRRGKAAYVKLAPLYDRRASAKVFWNEFFAPVQKSTIRSAVGL